MHATAADLPTAPHANRQTNLAMTASVEESLASAPPPTVEAIVVPPEGVREMSLAGEAVLSELLEKCPDSSMKDVWRRAAFWENETATMLELVNVLGRFESCSEWSDRSIFVTDGDISSREEDERQSLTKERHQMALRLKCGERAALWQNAPNLPFTNAELATSLGLTVEDFQRLPVTRAACEILYDGLAESRSTLIPYGTLDARRNAMVNADGTFNQVGFRVGWSKSCILFLVGLFLFGKANFIWVLVGVKFLHDWKPDLIPGPKELGLFKIWGIV